MKRLTSWYFIPIILIASIWIYGCKKEEVPVIIPEANEVNKFVYTGLHDYYLWNNEVPALYSTKYNNTDSLNAFSQIMRARFAPCQKRGNQV